MLCLTATAGVKTRKEILKVLHMRDTKVVKLTPDKPNCRFAVEKVFDNEKQLKCFLEELKEKKEKFPQTIIYCRSIAVCGELFSLFRQDLEGVANSMFAMYHSKTPPQIQEKVLASLTDIDGLIRCVFATNALGLGVNFPNIRRVVHYGIPRDMEEYVQEIGRGGRDKGKFDALVLYKPYHLAHCDDQMKRYIQNPGNKCRRELIMEFFKEKPDSKLPFLHDCCDICTKRCDCEKVEMHYRMNKFTEASSNVENPSLVRSVSDDDRALLKEVLLENLTGSHETSIFGIAGVVNSLDKTTVESIVEKCQFVFNIDYILDNFPILSHDLAHNILVIVNEVFGDIQEAVESSQLQLSEIDSDSLLVQVSDWCTEFSDTADSDDSDSCSEDPIDC